MHNFNLHFFHLVHDLSGKSGMVDTAFVFITTHLTHIVVIGVGLYIMLWVPLRVSDPMKRLMRIGRGVELATTLCGTWFLVTAIKLLVAHPRPFEVLMMIRPLVIAASQQSFPSGHSAFTMALATFVYIHYRRLGGLLFLFAFVVGFSRMYVGVHYPIDVGVGWLIGFVIAKIFHRLFTLRVTPKQISIVK